MQFQSAAPTHRFRCAYTPYSDGPSAPCRTGGMNALDRIGHRHGLMCAIARSFPVSTPNRFGRNPPPAWRVAGRRNRMSKSSAAV